MSAHLRELHLGNILGCTIAEHPALFRSAPPVPYAVRRGARQHRWLCLLVLLVAVVAGRASAAVPTELLRDGHFQAPANAWKTARVRWRTIPAPTQVSGNALRAEASPEAGQAPWDWSLRQVLAQPLKTGDYLLLRAWMRSDERIPIGVYVEEARPPYQKDLQRKLTLSPEWKEYRLVGRIRQDHAPGAAHLTFHLGAKPGAVEFAAVALENHGPAPASPLAESVDPFDGRPNPDSWRAAALERIERIRKGDLVVRVVDARGRPVANADVEVQQTKHHFKFGSAVGTSRLRGHGPDDVRYQREVERLFNTLVFEWEMKWDTWTPARVEATRAAISWARARGMAVRGHNLVWGRYQHAPALKGLSAEQMRHAIRQRVQSAIHAFNGQVYAWDVVNEAVSCAEVWEDAGWETFADTFRWARESAPGVKLAYNDFDISNQSEGSRHFEQVKQRVRFLLDQGAPVDIIGDQAHMSLPLTPISNVLHTWDELAALGLALEITEFDLAVFDDQLHAEYFRDFLLAAFSHPSVEAFILWGFWEGKHWRALEGAALFRTDWSPRPALRAYEDLVFNQWWTRARLRTGAEGSAKLRAFLGTHRITARRGKKQTSVEVSLRPGSPGRVTLTL